MMIRKQAMMDYLTKFERFYSGKTNFKNRYAIYILEYLVGSKLFDGRRPTVVARELKKVLENSNNPLNGFLEWLKRLGRSSSFRKYRNEEVIKFE